jgi:hypothetical protein
LRGRAKNSIPIYEVISVPCFEYWLLLHFVDSTRPYNRVGSKSAGDLLLSEVRGHIQDYNKGHRSIFEITKPNLKIATTRARKFLIQQTESSTDNPSTNMHELVEYLSNIKTKK